MNQNRRQLLVLALVITAFVGTAFALDIGRFREWRGLVFAVGLGLNVLGLSVALAGLAELSDFLLGRPLSLVRLKREFVRRLRPGRSGPDVRVAAGSASATGGAGAVVATGHREPPREATEAEWRDYVVEQLRTIRTELNNEANERRRGDDALRGALEAERGARETGLAELRRHVQQSIAGQDGSGLDVTQVGLVVTLLGVILQAIPSLL